MYSVTREQIVRFLEIIINTDLGTQMYCIGELFTDLVNCLKFFINEKNNDHYKFQETMMNYSSWPLIHIVRHENNQMQIRINI
jgi:hypothetical protein